MNNLQIKIIQIIKFGLTLLATIKALKMNFFEFNTLMEILLDIMAYLVFLLEVNKLTSEIATSCKWTQKLIWI